MNHRNSSEVTWTDPSPVRIRGGVGAPRRARTYVRSQLEGSDAELLADEAALIVSELVTNSVRHAGVGEHQTLNLEVSLLGNRVRIAVTDAGSELRPRIVPRDSRVAGGLGLRLVDEMSCEWGVIRDAGGPTRVWAELVVFG